MNREFKSVVPNPVEALKKGVAERKESYGLFCKAAEAVKAFNGKKITKAFATAVAKALPAGLTVSYSKEYGRFNTSIWGNGREFKNLISITWGFVETETFDFDEFLKRNSCYTLEEGRIPALEAELDVIEAKCNRYARALKELEEAEDDLYPARSYVLAY